MANVAERAGLVPRGTDVWGTSPTRSHEVLVMREGDGWVAWIGGYSGHAGGMRLVWQRTLYVGPDAGRAFAAAERAAKREVVS